MSDEEKLREDEEGAEVREAEENYRRLLAEAQAHEEAEDSSKEESAEIAEDVQSESKVSEERVFSDFEKEQMAKGWNPDGKYSAEYWAHIGSLTDEVKARGKAIKNLEHKMRKAERRGYEQALEDLKQQRRDAVEWGDLNKLDEFDDHIHDVRAKIQSLDREEEDNIDPEANLSPEAQVKYAEAEAQKFLTKYQDILFGPTDTSAKLFEYMDSQAKRLALANMPIQSRFENLERLLIAKKEELDNSSRPKSMAVEAGITEDVQSTKDVILSPKDLNAAELMVYNYELGQNKARGAAYLKALAKERSHG